MAMSEQHTSPQLIRALGFTAAGATVSIPVLITHRNVSTTTFRN
jgi:hypothetical protein